MFTRNVARVAIMTASCVSLLLPAATGYGAAVAAGTSTHKQAAVRGVMPATDETAIRAMLATLKAAVINGDAKGITSLFTEDGRYVDELGNVSKGKAELEKNFAEMAQENAKQPVEIVGESICMPAPNVALVEGSVNRAEIGSLVPVTHFSMALVKQKGEWKIASASESSVASVPAGNPLEVLSWLIGNWTIEKNGVKIDLKSEWVPSKNFIMSRYEISRPGESTQVETQVIGWNPIGQHPVSWTFDSSGGFGQGDWQPKGNQWIVDASSVERDGNQTSSTNIYTPDANGFSWQSVNRRVNGVPVDDVAPLKVERLASK